MSNNNSHFKIDFFELIFLAEACIPPSPIARMSFWYKLTDTYYDQMSKGQRKKAFEWMSETLDRRELWQTNKWDVEAVEVFLNRYNPDNQYLVTTLYEGKTEQHEAFLHKGKYHMNRSRSIAKEYIQNVTKIEL